MNHLANIHLRIIGHRPKSRVCYCGFYKDNDSRLRAAAPFPDIPESLYKWEAELRNIAVVVNPGGHADGDISECTAVFYEHDDMDKEKSKSLWRELSLPEPTLQIDTGNRSIHITLMVVKNEK